MKKLYIYLLCFFITSTISQAQNLNKVLGDNYFNHFAYAKAIKHYEKVLKNDSSNIPVLQHLAQSYKHSGNFNKAEEIYELLKTNKDTLSMHEYAQLLIYNNKYSNADSLISQFNLSLPNYDKQLIDNLLNEESEYKVTLAGINSQYCDFRPCFYGNYLIFASARDTSKKEYEWNGQPFLSLFMTNIYKNGELKHVRPFSKIDSRYHISSFHYVRRERLAYFTMNNANDFDVIKDANNEVNLGIYVSKQKRGQWLKPKPVEKVSSKDYSSAHPFYSPDDNRLYFSSNRPGGFGGNDIYYLEITGYGLTEPVNCGENINTPGDEMYPFVHPSGVLYFSSNGHPGLGGLDIFSAQIDDDVFGNVENLGVPINSSRDDFSLVFNEDYGIGYFSSNRLGGKGDDDIYLVKSIKQVENEVKEAELLATTNEEKKEAVTEEGNSNTDQEDDDDYSAYQEVIVVNNSTPEVNPTDIPGESALTSNKNKTIETMSEILDKTNIEKATTDNLNQLKSMKFRLNNINFDFNSWDINAEAAKELDKLVALMNKHKSMAIELSSHTDSRGNNAYNTVLSQARADAALKYIIKQGIHVSRVIAKGYGEQKLLNHCEDGIECSEELHKENRRVEVIITNFKTLKN